MAEKSWEKEERHLPGICAAAAAGDRASLRRRISQALGQGVGLVSIEEAILQCYLFAGFPAALEGLAVLRETPGGKRKSRPRAARRPRAEVQRRGIELCARVYGGKYEALRRRSIELHPEIWEWMIVEGYGKVLSRRSLPPWLRELCVVATLAATGWERQLRSHVHGALNLGCTPGQVLRAARTAGRVSGPWVEKWATAVVREEARRAADPDDRKPERACS